VHLLGMRAVCRFPCQARTVSTLHLIEPVRLLDEEQQPLEGPAEKYSGRQLCGGIRSRSTTAHAHLRKMPVRAIRFWMRARGSVSCAVHMWVRPSRELLRGAVEDESRAQVIQQFPVWQRHDLQAPLLSVSLIYGTC
jgi:hypothetical protein